MSTNAISIPSTMRAWTYTQPGPPTTALTFTKTHPAPNPSTLARDEVLVQISHCGLNAGVAFIMQLLPTRLHHTPAVPELDLSGTVLACGPLSTQRPDLAPGTHVYGCCPPPRHFRRGAGTLAEYVVLPADTVAPVPATVPLAQSACLAACACTAVQIVRRAGITRGDAVFVHGGSGGLGSTVVQVVKAAVGPSGRVVATCSGRNVEFVRGLGADEVLDYTAHPGTRLGAHLEATYGGRRFDAVVDTVGVQELYVSSPAYLKPSGMFLNAGGMTIAPSLVALLGFFWMTLLNHLYPAFLPRGVPRKFAFLSGYANEKDLKEVTGLVDSGKLKVPIDSVWDMEEALKGYAVIESKRARGKVVVRVQDVE